VWKLLFLMQAEFWGLLTVGWGHGKALLGAAGQHSASAFILPDRSIDIP
jgi:hypothetical protein